MTATTAIAASFGLGIAALLLDAWLARGEEAKARLRIAEASEED